MAMGSFSMQLAGFTKKANADIKTVVQKIGMEAFSRIIMRTPVDEGRLRANWGCQIGSPYAGYNDAARDKAGMETVAKATTTIQGWNGQGSIFLCNNASYAIPIEYGSSTIKSPAGMVRVVVAEMGGVATSIAQAGK